MGKLEIGSRFFNSEGLPYEVLEDLGAMAVKVEFLKTGHKRVCQRSAARRGHVKDPYNPTVYGVGWVGEGRYTARVDGKLSKQYSAWVGMFTRCYSFVKGSHWKSYRDNTEVSEEFLDFQKFAEWFDENYVEGWDLDKDVLSQSTGTSLYSKDTCIFLPPRINKCLIGQPKGSKDLPTEVTTVKGTSGYIARLSVGSNRKYLGIFDSKLKAFSAYRDAKLALIRELLEEYKHQLTETTYTGLLNYEIIDHSSNKLHLHWRL